MYNESHAFSKALAGGQFTRLRMTTDSLYYLCIFGDSHCCNLCDTEQMITCDILHDCINSDNLSQDLFPVYVHLCYFLLVIWVAAVHNYKYGCHQVLAKVDHLALKPGTAAQWHLHWFDS